MGTTLTDTPDTDAVMHDSPAVEDDGALSVDQAAAHFGVSERTIHRRIKQGQLQARKVDTPRGQVWRVYVDGSAVIDDTSAVKHDSTMHPAKAGETIEMVRLVDRLTRENTQLAGQVGYLQRQVQEQQETIQRLLAPPKDEPAEEHAAPAQPERRSWWQRLRGRG